MYLEQCLFKRPSRENYYKHVRTLSDVHVSQTNPGQPLSSPPGLATQVGYILNGQPITFLTPGKS